LMTACRYPYLGVVAAACPSRVVLAVERVDVIAARVQVLAAGQAPWAACCPAVVAADPESSRVVSAVDAELDGVRQQAGHDCGPLPRAGGRGSGSGPVLVGRHARSRSHVLDEPSGRAVVPWPVSLAGFLTQGQGCARLSCAAWPAPRATASWSGIHELASFHLRLLAFCLCPFSW